MSLTTEFGRFDRHAVTLRALEIHQREGVTWQQALTTAYREASAEMRARFNPASPVAIRKTEAA